MQLSIWEKKQGGAEEKKKMRRGIYVDRPGKLEALGEKAKTSKRICPERRAREHLELTVVTEKQRHPRKGPPHKT